MQPQTHRCKFLIHRYRNFHVNCRRPSEKTAFKNVRGHFEVNTVLTTAGVLKGNKIASWTKDQKTVHTAKQKDLPNMVKFGVVEVVDRPQSQQVITTRLEQTMRIVAQGFEQIVSLNAVFCRSVNAHDFSTTSHFCCNSRTMPNESEPVYVEQVLEDRWILPMFGSARKHFKVSRFSHSFGVFIAHRKPTT